MRLAYTAYDQGGREVADTIEATDVADANEVLRRKGLYVTKMNVTDGAAQVKRRRRGGGRGRRLRDLAMFTRQLYVLVTSGCPLVDALSTMERQVKEGPWRDAIADIRDRVEEGRPLAEAMERHGQYFDPIYRGLIAAGEAGGALTITLDRLAALSQKQLRVRNSIIGATIYPALLMVVAMGVLGLLLTFVIPRFGELFATLDAPLPPTTKALMWLSEFLRGYWWAVLGVLVTIGLAVRHWLGTPHGRRTVDTIVLRLPQFGRIVRSFITARIARLIGILLEARIPITEALRLSRDAAGNVHYVELIRKAEEIVVAGEPISTAFADERLISPSVYEAVRSGEQSGKVGPLLLNIADFMDEDNEVVVRTLTSILEPVILIVMGILVAFVALSLFTPLFDVTGMMEGGG